MPSGGRGRKFAPRSAKRDDRRTKCARRARAKGPSQSSRPNHIHIGKIGSLASKGEAIFVHLDAGRNMELKKKFTDLRSESGRASTVSRVRRTWRLCRQPNLPTPTNFSRQHSEKRSTLSNAYPALSSDFILATIEGKFSFLTLARGFACITKSNTVV